MREENEIENVKEVEGNVFTKNESNNIIREDYNPLKVNYKLIYEEREGIQMKELKKEELKEKLNLKEFTNKRIMENINLFSDKEMEIIKNNSLLIEKIYILGVLDNI